MRKFEQLSYEELYNLLHMLEVVDGMAYSLSEYDLKNHIMNEIKEELELR
jgi:hypothetical protein